MDLQRSKYGCGRKTDQRDWDGRIFCPAWGESVEFETMPTARTAHLARVLLDRNVDAYLACTPVSMGYLHGFFEDAHERFLTLAISSGANVRAIVPSLSATQASRAGLEDIHSWADGEHPMGHVQRLAADWNLKSVAVDDMMPAKSILEMQKALPNVQFFPGQSILAELMRIKDSTELELMRKSARIADDVFNALLGFLKVGLSEQQVEAFIRDEFTKRGGAPTFCIVGAGAGGAEPHHINGDSLIQSGEPIILDFGCECEGYQSDITRTVCIGAATERAKLVYETVYRAYSAGRAAIQPGVTCGSVDAAARQVIVDAGFGPNFFHRLGHGIGMNIHEEPYIVGGNEELLSPGNCFSVEPGIYLPGEFGVRIETIVTCTVNGHENLNAEPSPTLLEL